MLASRAANTNKPVIVRRGRNPPNCFSDGLDCCLAGRPKKYLRGPPLLMLQETASVARVASSRTRGNVPE